MTYDLFAQDPQQWRERLAPDAWVLRRYALTGEDALLKAIKAVEQAAPFRHMETPGGFRMSVAMTSCGELGWTSSRSGYRYLSADPSTERAWPPMPAPLRALAIGAAAEAGFAEFEPDACLINRYAVGSKLSLHQDRDEQDLTQPVVSVSLGLPAVFQFGGMRRKDPLQRVPLEHGDVVVWGGRSRLHYHGVLTIKAGDHPRLGAYRYNLTFRKAG